MRGYDLSVTKPDSAEVLAAKQALGVTYISATFVKLLLPQYGQPDALCIAEAPGLSVVESPMGRGSRGFTAYDPAHNKVVWIKDYWRIDEPDMEKEGDIYQELRLHNVPHIPTFERGDVTKTDLCKSSNQPVEGRALGMQAGGSEDVCAVQAGVGNEEAKTGDQYLLELLELPGEEEDRRIIQGYAMRVYKRRREQFKRPTLSSKCSKRRPRTEILGPATTSGWRKSSPVAMYRRGNAKAN
jgi:hypothetical protein